MGDPLVGLLADPGDLVLRPLADAGDVLVRPLAQLGRLVGGAGVDRLDVRLCLGRELLENVGSGRSAAVCMALVRSAMNLLGLRDAAGAGTGHRRP